MKLKYLSIIGVLLFIYIISTVNLKELFSIIINIDLFWFSLALLSVIIEVLVKAFRWQMLVNMFSKSYSLIDAVETHLIGIAFGAVTPAKSGDLIKSLDLKDKTKLNLEDSLSISIFDKIIDSLFLFLTGIFSLLIIVLVFSNQKYFVYLIFILAAIIFGLLLVLSKRTKNLLKPFFNIFIPERFKDKIRRIYISFHETSGLIKKNKNFYFYLFLTIVFWLILFIRAYLYGQGISLNVSLWYFLLFIPVVLVVETLPISIFGIGTRDILLIVLFSFIGVSKIDMIAISTLTLFFAILPQVILGFLISWKRNIKII